MRIIAALELCQLGRLVRPVCWRGTAQDAYWVKAFVQSGVTFFAEVSDMEEIPHALRLAESDEFLGEWEAKP